MSSEPSIPPPPAIDARTRDLLEAPLGRTILRLAAPNAVVMATQVSLGLIEMYFLAKLGVDELAGVSQVFPLVSLTSAISQGANAMTQPIAISTVGVSHRASFNGAGAATVDMADLRRIGPGMGRGAT